MTGLDRRRDAILAWAAVPIDGGRVVLGGAREGLVHPPGTVPAESIRIHGLRELDLAGAPSPEEAADALLEALTGRVLVAHAAEIERAFLGRLRTRGARLRGPVVDTRLLGRLWLAERDGRAPARLSLTALAEALGLPVHRPHRAAGDALTTAQAFIALAALLGDDRAFTCGRAAAARGAPAMGRSRPMSIRWGVVSGSYHQPRRTSMSKVYTGASVSLDGYISGPKVRLRAPVPVVRQR